MRKLVLIVGTLVAIAIAFAIYIRFQPQANLTPDGPSTLIGQPGPTSKPGGTQLGPGKGVWVTQYDRDTGRKTYRFRADSYDNQPDGAVRVVNPEIEFFQTDGQIIHIQGIDGNLGMTPGADRGMFNGATTEPPRTGYLNDVTVKIYNNDQLEAQGQQQLTLTMANAQFDNPTFRLFTQEYTDTKTGKTIHADEVPVTIRGKDYDFDGSGMVMFWNEKDKRLASLEIDHGKQLTIHNASAFSPSSPHPEPLAPSRAEMPPVSPVVIPVASSEGRTVEAPVVLAANSTPRVPIAPPEPKQRYFATFYDDVRVVQAGKEIVTGREMYIDFALKGRASATEPTGVPASPPVSPSPPANVPAPAPAATQPTVATTQPMPATQPQPRELQVYWKGKLRIVPTEENAEPLAPGQTILRLVGDPVMVHGNPASAQQQNTEVRAAELTYYTADGSIRLAEGPNVPLTIVQNRADGSTSSTIHAQHLQFSRVNHIAVLEGTGHATFPDPNDPKSMLNARWDKDCIVHLASGDTSAQGDQMRIQRADLSGKVVVDHPRFHLASEELSLAFDSARKNADGSMGTSEIREMVANGDARCVAHEAAGQSRMIEGQKLQLRTDHDSTGRLYARTIDADGSVTATQNDQDLKAQHLTIELAPSAGKPGQPAGADSVEVRKLVASDSVHVSGKDGASGAGDQLVVEVIDGHQNITLTGKPMASVVNKDSTLSGPVIHFVPDDQTATVEGPGTLVTVQQSADAKAKPRPLRVKWQQGLMVDSSANEIRITGDVYVRSQAADGAVDLARGDHLLLKLADKSPTTRGSEKPAPATQPATVASAQYNFMQNKEVQTMTLLDNAQVESSLTLDSTLLRRFDLFGKEINYDVMNRKLTIPVAGRMLSENHATTRPTDASPAGGRGATAFRWSRQFTYDEPSHQAVYDGDVFIVHRDDGDNPRQMQITGDRVIADFNSTGASQPQPAQGGDSPSLQLRKVTVQGHVTVTSGNTTITAGVVEFDPLAQRLICRSGDQDQVTVTDDEHRGGATFGEVWLNTKTNVLEKMTDLTAHGRG